MQFPHRRGILLALASAALFGASTPLAKLLLGSMDPWLLAGLLYLGSGLGLAAVHWAAGPPAWRRARHRCAAPTCRGSSAVVPREASPARCC